LKADEARKPQFYRAVEEASKQCQPAESGLPPSELADAQIAEATSGAAMKMVLAREERRALNKDDRIADFVTDACATVGIPTIAQQEYTRWTKRWSNWGLRRYIF
jgi:hypothetical protein